MAVATKPRTDEEIQQAVLEELKWDSQVQPNEIGVAVTGGVVTLTGWVDSYAKKWAAEEAAHRVHGVKAVANDIEVRLPTSAERPDPDIAQAVIRAIEQDAGVPVENLDVTVSNGWVTLRGQVDWQSQVEEVERAVRRIKGVRGITNLITVQPHITPDPEQLKRRIEEALVRNASTDAQNVVVEVDRDKVILRGTVRSWTEKREAERIAWSFPGVGVVENRIEINY